MRQNRTPVVTDNVLRRSDRLSKSSSTDVLGDTCSREGSAVLVSSPEEGDRECCCSPSTNREVTASSQSEENTRGLPEPPMPILPATAVCPTYILVPVDSSAVLSQQYGIVRAQPAIDFGLLPDSQSWCHKPVTVFEGPTPQSTLRRIPVSYSWCILAVLMTHVRAEQDEAKVGAKTRFPSNFRGGVLYYILLSWGAA
jgi:hypothetical protein